MCHLTPAKSHQDVAEGSRQLCFHPAYYHAKIYWDHVWFSTPSLGIWFVGFLTENRSRSPAGTQLENVHKDSVALTNIRGLNQNVLCKPVSSIFIFCVCFWQKYNFPSSATNCFLNSSIIFFISVSLKLLSSPKSTDLLLLPNLHILASVTETFNLHVWKFSSLPQVVIFVSFMTTAKEMNPRILNYHLQTSR